MNGYGKSHKTAIVRKSASAPVKWLISKGLLIGRILDYGCGKGDICKFTNLPNAEQWDPTWHPQLPVGLFDTIYNGYVLNIMPDSQRMKVINGILSYLKPEGTAYIAVRRDIKKEGLTKLGTEQYNATPPLYLPVIHHETGKYILYSMKHVH